MTKQNACTANNVSRTTLSKCKWSGRWLETTEVHRNCICVFEQPFHTQFNSKIPSEVMEKSTKTKREWTKKKLRGKSSNHSTWISIEWFCLRSISYSVWLSDDVILVLVRKIEINEFELRHDEFFMLSSTNSFSLPFSLPHRSSVKWSTANTFSHATIINYNNLF